MAWGAARPPPPAWPTGARLDAVQAQAVRAWWIPGLGCLGRTACSAWRQRLVETFRSFSESVARLRAAILVVATRGAHVPSLRLSWASPVVLGYRFVVAEERRRLYARFFVRLPQIDIAHHAAERFLERSKNAYPHCRHPFKRGH